MFKWSWPLAALVVLSSCVGPGQDRPPYPPIDRPPEPVLENAAAAGVTAGPSFRALRLTEADASAALSAFRASCDWPSEKADASGLTRPEDWLGSCAAAHRWEGDALTFFETYFETAQIGDGTAFATGYFEPEILGSRTPRPGYDVPVYRVPDDLVRAWPADMPESEREGRPPLGRYDDAGNFVEYYSRAEIEDGALAGRGLEIAWAADPVEFFFLQIQGSGLLRAPDGSVMRIGYAGQNGHGYTGIGGLMRERGLLGDGPGQYPGSMQGIMQYIRENPDEGRALMRENESWVFFRELTTSGPLGSLGVPVTRGSSVAVDPRFVPYGAPVVLDMDRDIADGLWVAQDTGGAIKGANRFDTFWGNGGDSREVAGGMSARGHALILLPKGTVARLTGR